MYDPFARIVCYLLFIQTGDGKRELTVQPNPVKDFIQVVWNNMEAGNYKIDLVNSSGQLITSYNAVINNIYETMILRREARWKTGLYILHVSTKSGQAMNYKFLIE